MKDLLLPPKSLNCLLLLLALTVGENNRVDRCWDGPGWSKGGSSVCLETDWKYL